MAQSSKGRSQWKQAITSAVHSKSSFFLKFIKYPAMVGSVCPSSAALTRQLLQGVSVEGQGLVIDLGSGSGPVSECMVRLGISKDRIIAIDALGEFKDSFVARCPGIPFIIGDAGNLRALLDQVAPGRDICAIVSSLPFRAMGPKLTNRVLAEIHSVLRERGGCLVQYSYAWWLQYPLVDNGFEPVAANIVWNNLPPAKVESYYAAVLSPAMEVMPAKRGVKHFVNKRLPGEALRALLAGVGMFFKGVGFASGLCMALAERATPESMTRFFRK